MVASPVNTNPRIDYHAFGMQIEEYSFVEQDGGYRYGFNGKETDNEWGSGDGIQDYGFRLYSPALGKFLSVDPLTKGFPMLTPYQFASNSPVWCVDLDGLEAMIATDYSSISDLVKRGGVTITIDGSDKIKSIAKESISITHKWSEDVVMTTKVQSGMSEKQAKELKDKFNEDYEKGSYHKVISEGFQHPVYAYYRNDLKKVEQLASGPKLTVGGLFWSTAIEIQGNAKGHSYPIWKPGGKGTEYGLSNTINHFTGQAIITSIFGGTVAELTGDMHERLDNGDVSTAKDNIIDMINNEWGRQFGEELAEKYDIDSDTKWTPQLTADYLNDIQSYLQKSLEIKSFDTFNASDKFIIDFTNLLNSIVTPED